VSLAAPRPPLGRLFRSSTGFSLHGYRNQLRLRAALERIADPETRLTALASELGFSCHIHFTAAFRETFGVAPSELRGRVTRGRLQDVLERHSASKNVPLSAASGCD